MNSPLAIIQARLESTRLPRKMLQDLGGHPLLWWSWEACIRKFGAANVVIASPAADVDALRAGAPDAHFYGWPGDPNDVLGRLHACAHEYTDDARSVLWRITPDDWPPQLYREPMTLSQLDYWHEHITSPFLREHVGHLILGRQFEINTPDDLEAARAYVQSHER